MYLMLFLPETRCWHRNLVRNKMTLSWRKKKVLFILSKKKREYCRGHEEHRHEIFRFSHRDRVSRTDYYAERIKKTSTYAPLPLLCCAPRERVIYIRDIYFHTADLNIRRILMSCSPIELSQISIAIGMYFLNEIPPPRQLF